MRKLKNNELERKTVLEFKKANKIPVIIILDNIRSLNNIGSVFRTSDAFMIENIFLCGITATPPHNEIRKTALGSTKSVNWIYFKNIEDAIRKLKSENYKIISVEQVENGIMLQNYKIDRKKRYALIFGNEVKGVQQKVINLSDDCIEIRQEGTKHSLNISVCAGIVIWEFYKNFIGKY